MEKEDQAWPAPYLSDLAQSACSPPTSIHSHVGSV